MKPSTLRRFFLAPGLAAIALATGSLLEGYTLMTHKWGVTNVPYYVNPQNRWVSENAAISAVQAGAAAWNEQSNANITLVYSGQTNGSSLTLNHKSEVFFRGGSANAIAQTYVWWDSSGKYVDGDVVFYEDVYTLFAGSGCATGVYVEDVAVHEFGHLLGLGHSAYPGVTMQPNMPSYCDLTQMTLEPDDIAGVEALYPPQSGSNNTAPSVTVGSPGNESSHPDGATINFSGSASDSQEGNVSGNLRWTSNLSGLIGTGAAFSRSLPTGVHLVTAAATDGGGLTGSRQFTVTVTANAAPPPPQPPPPQPPPPSGASLNARGYKVKGMQKVNLSWSGLTSDSVDLYRNDAKVGTTPNSGSATNPINKKGGGSYRYKVCAAGTSTCSNSADVSF